MGGRANMWKSGSGKDLGVTDKLGNIIKHQDAQHLSEKSGHDDDQLEFQTISSVLHLSMGKA